MLAEARVTKGKVLRGQWPRERAARHTAPRLVRDLALLGLLSIPIYVGGLAWAGVRLWVWLRGGQ